MTKPATLHEAFIEGMYVAVLSALSLYLSWHLLRRIKYLEGFVHICSFCKRVNAGNDWKSLEEYIGTIPKQNSRTISALNAGKNIMANVIARRWRAGKMMLLRYRKAADILRIC